MLIAKHAEIVINNSREAIWDHALNPVNWVVSNPEEHFGLTIDTKENRPKTGAAFHQKEAVAGVHVDLHGIFSCVEKPEIVIWHGRLSISL